MSWSVSIMRDGYELAVVPATDWLVAEAVAPMFATGGTVSVVQAVVAQRARDAAAQTLFGEVA